MWEICIPIRCKKIAGRVWGGRIYGQKFSGGHPRWSSTHFSRQLTLLEWLLFTQEITSVPSLNISRLISALDQLSSGMFWVLTLLVNFGVGLIFEIGGVTLEILSRKYIFSLVRAIFFLIKFSIMLLSLGIFNWPIQKWVVNWKSHSIRPRHGWESIGLRRRSNIRLWNSRLWIYFHALVWPATQMLGNLTCLSLKTLRWRWDTFGFKECWAVDSGQTWTVTFDEKYILVSLSWPSTFWF